MANHGKAQPSSPSYAPSLVHLSADFSTILGEILLAPIYPGIESVQGIVYDKTRDTLWFADPAHSTIRHISSAGVPQSGDIVLSFVPNGLARDDADDALWINTLDTEAAPDVLQKRRCSDGTLLSNTTLALADHDQLYYDDAHRQLFVSYGANGAVGKVGVYDAPAGTLFSFGVFELSNADAIEGIVMQAGILHVANDAYYHSGNPALNRVLNYSTNY